MKKAAHSGRLFGLFWGKLLLEHSGNFLQIVHDGKVLGAALFALTAGDALRGLAVILGKVRIVEGLDGKALVRCV